MDRIDLGGVGIALVGHVAVLAALTFGLMRAGAPMLEADPVEVSFVEEVALASASPAPSTSPAPPAAAPELGRIEEAAPSAPPLPAPRAEPLPTRPSPSQAAPPAKPRDTRDRRRPEENRTGQAQRTRGSRLADLDLNSLGRDPATPRASPAPAQMSGQAAANIAQAIARQVQPCADRQVYPGPGAERIVTPIVLRLNRDGSLAARPRVGAQRGIDDENRRYAQRVADLAIRSFVECSPLRGLPDDLYDVPRGWSNFTMNYRMPG